METLRNCKSCGHSIDIKFVEACPECGERNGGAPATWGELSSADQVKGVLVFAGIALFISWLALRLLFQFF